MSAVERLCAPSRELLIARATQAPRGDGAVTARLRSQLVDRLAACLGAQRDRQRIDAFVAEHGPGRFDAPFSWSARASRRQIGTAAARHVAAAVMPDALSAAVAEIERLCDRAHRGLARRGALGTWLAAAPDPIRALCAVEAATWAERVLRAVDPAPGDGTLVGIPDAWFEVPGTSITLHGRRDAAMGCELGSPLALLRVRDGLPGALAVDGLVVDALIAALEGPSPARIIGTWPDAGVHLIVEFDDEAARRAARVIVSCAEAMAATHEPSHTTAVAA